MVLNKPQTQATPDNYSFFLIDRDRREIVSAKRLTQIVQEHEQLRNENRRLKQINGCLRTRIANLTRRRPAQRSMPVPRWTP